MLMLLVRDFELTGDEHAKAVMIEAAESLMDRYNPTVGPPSTSTGFRGADAPRRSGASARGTV